MTVEMTRRKTKKNKSEIPFPTREEIIQFLLDNPGRAGKRELARAFGLKNEARHELKLLLRDLRKEGVLAQRRKQLVPAATLPRVSVLDIVSRDRGGALLAKPVAWDEITEGKPPVVRIKPSTGKKPIVAGIGDRILGRIEKNREEGAEYTAAIVKLLDRKENLVLGVLRINEKQVRLEPTIRGQNEIEIDRDALNDARDGDLVEVEIVSKGKFGLRQGRVTKVVGNPKSEKAISMIAIHANAIRHEFPPAVLEAAGEAEPIDIDNGQLPHEDWRDIPLITIDPADAKDHDDAIHAIADPEVAGGYIASVAIADVSWYVRPNSDLDNEALLRGNSVYFPDRVIPMLPERISNDLCSLREGESRPAIAVRMWFDADGRRTRHKFHRIIMKSHARLSYQETQAAIDGNPGEKTKTLLKPVIEPLWEAWKCMNRGRNERAPLGLEMLERKIILDKDGSVDRVIAQPRLDAHRLIEEFMIQANVCAAETLETRKQRLVYRIHDAPSRAKLESLHEFLKSMNLSLVRAGNIRASHFNSILDTVSGTDREELVNQVILRTQSQAEYSPKNIGHFGLNLMRYAHFTSPIRRYADLIVHRALITALNLGEGGITRAQEERLEEIAADISVAERRAMTAERDTVDRLIADHLSEQIGNRFAGTVNGVTRAGLFVTLSETGADGFIPISKISDDYYHFDEANYVLVGQASGLGFQIGQEVEVKLVEAAPVAGALRFEMLSEGKPFKKVVRSRKNNHSEKRQYSRKKEKAYGKKKT
jgi:ribonuclease R